MKTIDEAFVDQSRWNAKAAPWLERSDRDPSSLLIDPHRFSPIRQDLVRAIVPLSGKSVLELGSGRGEFATALAKIGARVVGVEIGEDLVMLSRKIALANASPAEFTVGSIEKLTFADDSFDYVVGNAILHHLPKQGVVDALSEAHRVLRRGGAALFTEPIENSRVFDFMQNLLPTGSRPSILQRRAYARFLSAADDRALSDAELRQAGAQFSAIDFRYYGLLVRLSVLLPNDRLKRALTRVDVALTAPCSPLRKLGQQVLVTFTK